MSVIEDFWYPDIFVWFCDISLTPEIRKIWKILDHKVNMKILWPFSAYMFKTTLSFEGI